MCDHRKTVVYDSRQRYDDQGHHYVARRRRCVDCGATFSTAEIPLDRLKALEQREAAVQAVIALSSNLIKGVQ